MKPADYLKDVIIKCVRFCLEEREPIIDGGPKGNEVDTYRAYIVTNAHWEIDEDGDADLMETEVYEVNPETIGQYTGLKDKNDAIIFEGDIVKDSNGKIGRIEFLPQEMGYVIIWKTYDSRLGHRARGSGYNFDTSLEIIGNIYDNPELMEI